MHLSNQLLHKKVQSQQTFTSYLILSSSSAPHKGEKKTKKLSLSPTSHEHSMLAKLTPSLHLRRKSSPAIPDLGGFQVILIKKANDEGLFIVKKKVMPSCRRKEPKQL